MTTLSNRNKHDRDIFLQFDEPSHKYTITSDLDNKYTSVTTINKQYFAEFDSEKIATGLVRKHKTPGSTYYGMTVQDIIQKWKTTGEMAASLGTILHADIEHFMNDIEYPYSYTHNDLYEYYISNENSNKNCSIEWEYFIRFVRETPTMIPYRTEWMIYDKTLKIAGAVDMVYKNTMEDDDNTYSIYDWKRCKAITKYNGYGKTSIHPQLNHIPDTNYWHYALQLNTYKMILEKNYNIQITNLTLVRMNEYNNETNSYELINLPIMDNEMKILYPTNFQ